MPSFYAHLRFGREVFAAAPEKIRNAVTNINLFNMGLQGPDFLFFYKAYTSNRDKRINQLADIIHKNSCTDFLTRLFAEQTVHPATDTFSYLLGFVCHFALDHACHGYVEECVKTLEFDHMENETEFDRYLMQRDNKHPLHFKMHPLISITDSEARTISDVYKTYRILTPEIVTQCFSDFARIKKIFYAPSRIKQKILLFGLKKLNIYDSYQGCIMRSKINPHTVQTNERLFELYTQGVKNAGTLIENIYAVVTENAPLSSGFDFDFDT